QSVNNQKAPFIVDWGSCEGAPKIQGVIKVNNIIEGYVTMNCIHHPVTPESMKAMEIIQNVCAFFFKDNDTESSMYHTYQKAFIAELFNGRIQNNRQLDLWFQDTGMKLEPPYRIVTVTTLETNEKNVLSYIRKTVFQFFPYQLALIQQNVLYILQYNLDISPRTPNAEKLFHTSLSKFNAQCGVSNPFCSLLETPYYQLQAEDAMRLGKKFGSGYRIAYYKDYYLPAILSPRIDQMPMCNYVSPIITVLQKYDALHSTDFFNTLKCYVMNLCSTADTAEELHIHRNTLLYRVKKIEEISGYSLTDPDIFMHVMISFYMLHYA
ncbi:MAG: helix-turn-helix domain-containing protein, partial [Eubacteriales bacterium]|nr:helix-turn-helix domain-containing protein [Eubacteriales bacterium]